MSVRSLIAATWFAPGVIALLTWGILLSSLDPAGSYPRLPEGPGLTVDEVFNVQQGYYLVEAVRQYGIALLDPRSMEEVFGPQSPHLPDHPPLGRLWLGMHHNLARSLVPPDFPTELRAPVTACARTGSATAFALTVFFLSWFAARSFGSLTGVCTALCFITMPRLWGHAHLASLETITNLLFTLSVLSIAEGWNRASPPTVRASLLAGVILGLTFLTKIQAILLPIPIIIWTLWRWRFAGLKPLLIWGLAAAVVFCIGWPWIWLDPVNHLQQYFARTTARAELSVWYFGERYADKAIPWHYPWVIFFTTIPLGTLALGTIAIGKTRSQFRTQTVEVACLPTKQNLPRDDRSPLSLTLSPGAGARGLWNSSLVLFLLTTIFPLIVFALPNVAVYDCERLFLPVFPIWALLAGMGAGAVLKPLGSISMQRLRAGFISLILLSQFFVLGRYAPCTLSYYNALVGGTAGAEKLGLETTYWGDSLTRRLLQDVVRQVPPGSTIVVAPVLHQFQLVDLLQQSPILRRHQVQLQPYTGARASTPYLLIYRRRADLPDDLRFGPTDAELLAETRVAGTQLAALYRLQPTP